MVKEREIEGNPLLYMYVLRFQTPIILYPAGWMNKERNLTDRKPLSKLKENPPTLRTRMTGHLHSDFLRLSPGLKGNPSI